MDLKNRNAATRARIDAAGTVYQKPGMLNVSIKDSFDTVFGADFYINLYGKWRNRKK
jgi:hypothetical protein